MDGDIDSELADWLSTDVEERVIQVLGHVMLNLRDLPVFACDKSVLRGGPTWFPPYVACVEAFFTNARLSAEFFVRMPARDFNARMFVEDWSPPAAASQRLQRVWLIASKHFLHFSKDRFPTEADRWELEDLSYRALMRISRDAYTMLGRLVVSAEEIESPYAARLSDMHEGCRPHSASELSKLHGSERKRARLAAVHEFPDPYASVWWPH